MKNVPVCSFIPKFLMKPRNNTPPLIIWGSGYLGPKTGEFLAGNNIKFDAFAVTDAKYIPDAAQKLGVYSTHPVFIMKDYAVSNQRFVIVAFEKWQNELIIGVKQENIEHLYVLDLLGSLAISGESIYPDKFPEDHASEINQFESGFFDEKSIFALRAFLPQRMGGNFSKEYDKEPQYFANDIVKFDDSEIFVDCGSYKGELTLEFLSQMDVRGKKICTRLCH